MAAPLNSVHMLPESDARALELYRQGGPSSLIHGLGSPLARELGNTMANANGHSRDEALNAHLEGLPGHERNAIRSALIGVDLEEPSAEEVTEPRSVDDGADAPTLPDAVLGGATPEEWCATREAEAGAPAGVWVRTFVSSAQAISPMTPELFLQSAALWLLSMATARRLKVSMPWDDIYPNLWILWLADTTLWNKSTALSITLRIALRDMAHLLLPQDTTPEALWSDLAGIEPTHVDKLPVADQESWQRSREYAAQRSLCRDELSGWLASASKRDYNAGLLECMMQLYDCREQLKRRTQGSGLMTIHNAYVPLLTASTPEGMASYLSEKTLWLNGWWPRFGILTPESRQPSFRKACDREEPQEIREGLLRLLRRLPAPSGPSVTPARTLALGRGVIDDLDRYTKAVRHDLLVSNRVDKCLYGTYGRLPTQLLKVATLLAALDWPEADEVPRIDRHHLASAITIVERWRKSAHRALETAGRGQVDTLSERVVRILPHFLPQGATARQVQRRLQGVRNDDVLDILQELEEAGKVIRRMQEAGPKGGRPTMRYFPAS